MSALSIRKTVPLVILVPLLTYVGLTGWLAVSNGQQSVARLSRDVSGKLNAQILAWLKDYLETPAQVSKINADAIRLGELNWRNPSNLDRHFWTQILQFPEVSVIEFGNAQTGAGHGVFRLKDRSLAISTADATTGKAQVFYAVNGGQRGKVLSATPNFDARQRPWYQVAVKAGKPTWTEPFHTFTTKQLSLSAVQPVYEPSTGKLVGIVAVSCLLDRISNFLHTLKLGRSGKLFIVERSGELIATSSNEQLFTINGKRVGRVAAIASQEPAIRATAQYVQKQFKGFNQIAKDQWFEFSLQGETQLVEIGQFANTSGLDWLVVTVVPEKDFTQEIQETTNHSILLGLSALVVSGLLGWLASRWLVQPILQLNVAAAQVKGRDFDPASIAPIAQRTDEIGQLAQVFQEMAQTIYAREQSLKDRVQQLRNETDKAKQAALVTQLSGSTNLQTLLQRSQRIRLQETEQTLNLTTLLRQVPYFQSLTAAQLQQSIDLGYQKQFATKEFICREEELGKAFYIILAGSVEVYREKQKQPPTKLAAENWFGELSLLLGVPYSATVRTLETTTVWAIDQQGLRKLLQAHPQLAEQIAKQLLACKPQLEQNQKSLRQRGLLGDEKIFSQNFPAWIRQRLKTRFGI